MRATRATYRLGTEFRGWGAPEQRYFQGFGSIGAKLDAVPFQHHWLRLARTGECAALEEYSMAAQLARHGRFALPHSDPRSVLSTVFVCLALRREVVSRRVPRTGAAGRSQRAARTDWRTWSSDRRVISARSCSLTRAMPPDFFIDCSGARALLATRSACRSMIGPRGCPAIACSALDVPPAPRPRRSRSRHSQLRKRQPCGWAFSLPLQHGTVMGQVYASEFTADAEVSAGLMDRAGDAAGQPHIQRLMRGRPREFWVRNCLLMPGEALDPLESTGLHLAQTGITRLAGTFSGAHRQPHRPRGIQPAHGRRVRPHP